MDTYHLELAFYRHLAALAFTGTTYKPDDVIPNNHPARSRRGWVMLGKPETVGFGNGIYTRTPGIYQIDIYIDRSTTNALKVLKQTADAHATHFFPANGRGLTLTEEQTSAHITRRPNQPAFERGAAFLRQIVEIDFYVEIPAAG